MENPRASRLSPIKEGSISRRYSFKPYLPDSVRQQFTITGILAKNKSLRELKAAREAAKYLKDFKKLKAINKSAPSIRRSNSSYNSLRALAKKNYSGPVKLITPSRYYIERMHEGSPLDKADALLKTDWRKLPTSWGTQKQVLDARKIAEKDSLNKFKEHIALLMGSPNYEAIIGRRAEAIKPKPKSKPKSKPKPKSKSRFTITGGKSKKPTKRY
jgi:hypothetical protein